MIEIHPDVFIKSPRTKKTPKIMFPHIKNNGESIFPDKNL